LRDRGELPLKIVRRLTRDEQFRGMIQAAKNGNSELKKVA